MRSTKEWIGKTDDTLVPQRVRLRQFDRDGGRCRICAKRITGGVVWHTDHIVAIINKGENREKNLQTLCHPCHDMKTGFDVAEKAVTARKRAKHLGIAKPKGRGFRGWRKFNGDPVWKQKVRT